jgi:hypothetical protein
MRHGIESICSLLSQSSFASAGSLASKEGRIARSSL